ncbi:hypothetical protein IAU59_002569 [Kwoniella sp. CBS 9459]
MPSLLTSRAGSGSSTFTNGNGQRTLSKVNSFKREWGDDDEPQAESSLRGSSGVIDWSPSPERIKRKGNLFPPPSAPPQPKFNAPNPFPGSSRTSNPAGAASSSSSSMTETPAERRRRAMMASFSQNVDPAPPSSIVPPSAQKVSSAGPSSQSSSSASRPNGGAAPTQSFVSASSKLRDLDTPRVRQELPSLPTLPKRALPWEEEHTLSKKAMTRTGSGGKPKAVSTGPSVNIKQKVTLSAEQQKVLSLVVGEGKNIFFTGSAGTGKSVLLRELIKNLRKKYSTAPDAVAVTASTGIAACNIGGVTLHSFGGVGLAIEKPDILMSKLRKNKKAAARWQRTKVLIIDEVSMVDGEMFDKFCKLGQLIRKNPKPWGGIQVVVTGDFFQLPPVTKGGAVPRFCFEAAMWDETINMSVNLTKVFRQKDQRFVDMLNEMRFGKLTPKSIEAFRSLSRPIDYTDNIEPTELFPRREDVDKSNSTRLRQLNTDGYSYSAVDGGAVTDPVQREKLLANFMAPGFIELKIDAQVMLIKNVDESLVNGSMGKVIGFDWKSNNFDSAGRWDPDAVYSGMDEEEKYKQKKLEEALREKIAAGTKPYPVVRFNIPGGGTRDMLVEPDQFKAELPNGEVQASRSQLPLILAWAMSIHKSQGQTLDRVKVDLGKVFEKGQAYVALSRATSLEGLQVLGFTPQKVMAHRKVAVWSETLKDLNV